MELFLHFIQIPAQVGLPLVETGGIRTVLKLLFHGLQFFAGDIRGSTGFFNDVLRLPPCRLHGLFLFAAKLLIVFLALLLDFCSLLTQPLCLLPGSFHLLALLFQLGKDIFKVLIAFIDQVIRFLQDFLRQTQLAGNGKGIGLSGNADQKLIGGTQCLHVKFTGGIYDPLCAHSIQLELRIVGRSDNVAAHLSAKLNDSRCQSGALRRVRTGTQLIEQYQRPVVALGNHIHDGAHMA